MKKLSPHYGTALISCNTHGIVKNNQLLKEVSINYFRKTDYILRTYGEKLKHGRFTGLLFMLGPAFVVAIAYVDPGNVAANITSGAQYGYLLVWVLVLANLIAAMIQYQSAKLGLVTKRSLAAILGERIKNPLARRLYWLQAELAALATDVAEIVGGAVALWLLFGIPLPLGGLVVGIISLGILSVHTRAGQRTFETVIIGFLAIITVGFLLGLLFSPPSIHGILDGLVPRFAGVDSVLLAASMVGATIMPHAIYLHSDLASYRYGKLPIKQGLRHTRIDVLLALLLAGLVNICMLLLAASTLQGEEGTDSIEGAYYAIESHLGPIVGAAFAIGLLASGLASTAVGAHASASIMQGLLTIRIPLLTRRLISLIPAAALLWFGFDPNLLLILSQALLSFCIPFVLVPLIGLTFNKSLLGEARDSKTLHYISCFCAFLIGLLNIFLLYQTFAGNG